MKLIYVIIICVILVLAFMFNPFITMRYFSGCSMYPEIKYHSIDLMVSTKIIKEDLGDVVIYDGIAGKNIEHKIIGRCGLNNESYYIAGTDFISEGDKIKLDKDKIRISLKECVNEKDIHHKRIGGLDWDISKCI